MKKKKTTYERKGMSREVKVSIKISVLGFSCSKCHCQCVKAPLPVLKRHCHLKRDSGIVEIVEKQEEAEKGERGDGENGPSNQPSNIDMTRRLCAAEIADVPPGDGAGDGGGDSDDHPRQQGFLRRRAQPQGDSDPRKRRSLYREEADNDGNGVVVLLPPV